MGQWPIITPQQSDFSGVILGDTEKASLLPDICTAWKEKILFDDFFCNVNTLILWYNLAIFAKQTGILNFYQTTKHTTGDAT